MSSHLDYNPLARDELLQAVTRATYASSSAAVFFHAAIAEQVGLGPTEEKTLLMLSGSGPLTAGEIAQRTGLTTGSVTSLIDRMERKGFVRRVRDASDRRRVIVEADEARLADLWSIFGSFEGIFDDLYDTYSDEQLATLLDYLQRTARRLEAVVGRLKQAGQSQTERSG